MKKQLAANRFVMILLVCVLLCVQCFAHAFAHQPGTLYNGCTGDKVKELQEALISLGYLKGTADGIFGNNTENAVRSFQRKNRLSCDGLAGEKTLELIWSQYKSKAAVTATPAPQATATPAVTSTPAPQATEAPTGKSSSLFKGDYTTIRQGNRGERVKTLQQALISLRYLSGSADGIFGKMTLSAVISFQKAKKLSADGLAGKKTLSAIESAVSGGGSAPTATPEATAKPTATPEGKTEDGDLNPKISGPSASSVQLLHWFNVVKPSLSTGSRLLVYDPASGYSWTLRVLARGRHCDAEPLTAKDTRTMVAAFGGVNTWNQKAVYVKLPDGRWSLAATHDMPHDSGTIKDNGFDGHLCVHFLRDMDEAKKNDPNYGVSNQQTIRTYWKKLTGETVE